jgi:hypothetical protein
MRLESVILADAVSTPPDGKFYVMGGGISKLNPIQLPAAFPLGILVRFELEEGEPLANHRLAIRLLDPADQDILQGRAEVPIMIPDEVPQWADGEQRILSATVNVGGVPITREGVHRMILALDGEPVSERSLPVILVQPTSLQAALLREVQQGT